MFPGAWFRAIHIMLQQTAYIMEKGLPVIRTAQSKGDDNHQKLSKVKRRKLQRVNIKIKYDVTNQGERKIKQHKVLECLLK